MSLGFRRLNCAAMTAVRTDLCMFCIMGWLLDQQVPFQKKVELYPRTGHEGPDGNRGIALFLH